MFTSSIKTYLFSIGKYKIYEHLRAQSKLNLVDDILYEFDVVEELNIEEEHLTERQILIKENFKKLGNQCQLILELFYLKGQTLKDIKIIENYENTDVVKSQKSRCLRKLRTLMHVKK